MSNYGSNFTTHPVFGSYSQNQGQNHGSGQGNYPNQNQTKFSTGQHSNQTSVSTTYSRVDLQSAFNWLVNQPEHIRKQATDPDRLMTLYYRSSNRPEPAPERAENENTMTTQGFAADLRQVHEAIRPEPVRTEPLRPEPLRPAAVQLEQTNHQISQQTHNQTHNQTLQQVTQEVTQEISHVSIRSTQSLEQITGHPFGSLHPRTQSMIAEVREKLNLTTDAEAVNLLVGVAHKHLQPILS